MKRSQLIVLAACITSLLFPRASAASIQNIGVDIGSRGSQTLVPFFDRSAAGFELRGRSLYGRLPGEAITIVLDTASIFGGAPLMAAELFIDAFGIDAWNTSEIYVQGVLVGSLQNTPSRSSIPIVAGAPGTHGVNSHYDVDNTFINLAPFLADLTSDSTFTIQIRNTTAPFLCIFPGETIRIDGINIQVAAYDPLPVIAPGTVPEPAMMAVWSMLAAAGVAVSCHARFRDMACY